MYFMVLMVHNWFKAILNQLCTIGTNKYMYHKWKNHRAFSLEKEYFYHSLDVSVKNSANPLIAVNTKIERDGGGSRGRTLVVFREYGYSDCLYPRIIKG